MSEVVRLYILTDNPARAARHVFCADLEKLPAWVRVVSDWREISRLPEGAPCIAVWFPRPGPDGTLRTAQPSLAHTAYHHRRRDVRLDDDYQMWREKAADWVLRKFRAEDDRERRLIGLAPRADGINGEAAAPRPLEGQDPQPAPASSRAESPVINDPLQHAAQQPARAGKWR